jgi:hypothetical protein
VLCCACCVASRSAVHKALYQGSLAVAAQLLAAGGSLEVTDHQVGGGVMWELGGKGVRRGELWECLLMPDYD